MKVNKETVTRIKDIADKAGVSIGTVDRVIHKRGGVSPNKLKKVLKIIQDTNYQPNLMARVLVSQKKFTVAALLPDPKVDSFWSEPQEGIRKAATEMKQYGMTIKEYIFSPADKKSFTIAASELTKSKPDGILVAPVFYKESLKFFEKWKSMNVPFVLFNTQITEYEPLSYIGQDSYKSGLLAARLIDYGHHGNSTVLIAHIDEDIGNSAHLQKKEKGFRNYFNGRPGADRLKIVSAQLSRATRSRFVKEMDELIESNPDLSAIFVTTCKAYEIAKYLEQRQLSQLTVIGYDLLAENLHYLDKGRITFLINQNARSQGYWGIHALTQHLVFKQQVDEIRYLPLDIVTRENMNYYITEDRR